MCVSIQVTYLHCEARKSYDKVFPVYVGGGEVNTVVDAVCKLLR